MKKKMIMTLLMVTLMAGIAYASGTAGWSSPQAATMLDHRVKNITDRYEKEGFALESITSEEVAAPMTPTQDYNWGKTTLVFTKISMGFETTITYVYVDVYINAIVEKGTVTGYKTCQIQTREYNAI